MYDNSSKASNNRRDMENKKITSFEDLPTEINCHIFSRLSVKCLMGLKCVSRFFNSFLGLSRDPYLVDLHHNHQRHNSTKFLLRISITATATATATSGGEEENFNYSIDDENEKTVSFIKEKLDGCGVSSSSSYSRFEYAKGLFCLWSENFENPVFIFNPTTRESRFLPCLNINMHYSEEDFSSNYHCHYSLGFDPDLKKHKILMKLVCPNMRHSYVFTLGESTTWREINCDSVNDFYPILNNEGVYIDGAVYFFCGHCNTSGNFIVAFMFRTEEFTIIPLWDNYSHYGLGIRHGFNLVDLEGKLAAIDSTSRFMTAFILQSPETGKWVWQPQIDIPCKYRMIPAQKYVVHRRCTSTTDNKDQQIAVMTAMNEPNGIRLYDLKECKWRSIRILGLAENAKIIGIYSYEYCIYSLGEA